MSKTLIAIIGPTASGKTALSIDVAKEFNTEIINLDSRQFYREMAIGTAKPTLEEMDGVPHHFIDSHSIHDDYNAGQYEADALKLIDKLFQKHDTLVVVGGSGLYFQALLEGFDDFPEVPDALRKELKERAETEGLEVLVEELKKLDIDSYNSIDHLNSQRIRRALEVCMVSDQPFSSYKKKQKKKRPFDVIKIGIKWDRELLYNRINERVHKMMELGLENEVRSLNDKRHLNALKTVGYRELFDYIDGHFTLDQSIAEIQKNTRRYAKRQMTWFRKDDEIHWIEAHQLDTTLPFLREQLNC